MTRDAEDWKIAISIAVTVAVSTLLIVTALGYLRF
jgi:hypothetical protein